MPGILNGSPGAVKCRPHRSDKCSSFFPSLAAPFGAAVWGLRRAECGMDTR